MFSLKKSLPAVTRVLCVSLVMLSAVAVANSVLQDQKKTQLEGVWKVAEVIVPASTPADKPTTISAPQPGLLIFTKGYYSGTAVTGSAPRPAVPSPKDPQNLTDAEKIARYDQWRQFLANAGTYEVKGSTIVMHPVVAKNVNMMATGSSNTWEFKIEGANTLWLIPTAANTTDPRVKFTRVE